MRKVFKTRKPTEFFSVILLYILSIFQLFHFPPTSHHIWLDILWTQKKKLPAAHTLNWYYWITYLFCRRLFGSNFLGYIWKHSWLKFVGVLEGSSQQQRRMKNDKSKTLKSIGEKYFFPNKTTSLRPRLFFQPFPSSLFCDELACDRNKSRSQFGRRRKKNRRRVFNFSVY